MVVVAAAANESGTHGSSAWCPPEAIHVSSGKGWSVTWTASKPASSATRAISITPAPLLNSSPNRTLSVGRPTESFSYRLSLPRPFRRGPPVIIAATP